MKVLAKYFSSLQVISFLTLLTITVLQINVSAQTNGPEVVTRKQRLSQWLEDRKTIKVENAYVLGAFWTTQEELSRQYFEYKSIEKNLDELNANGKLDANSFKGIKHNLSIMRPTGRVPVAIAESKWLEAYPQKNPYMLEGDGFQIPSRPSNLRVMSESGEVCEIPHHEGLLAKDYVKACNQVFGAWSWVVQPNGRVQKVSLHLWNTNQQDQPAPGSWIWVPAVNSKLPEVFNLRWAKWLANQGVSVNRPLNDFYKSFLQTYPVPLEETKFDFEGRYVVPIPTASNWGNVGLIQMPTARMQTAGYFGLSFQRTWPYLNQNVFFQPLDWLEAGFRYTETSNRLYSYSTAFSGTLPYKDKSFDLKARFFRESEWVPEIALGFRDVGGTGLYSSEYLVSSKRTGSIDWTLGLGWGYLAHRANLSNPLNSILGQKYATRPVNDFGQGGMLTTKTWFHGPTALFGGFEYQTPWNFNIKVEYDGNNYQNEPQSNNLPVSSPINWALVYRPTKGLDISMGVERGNKFAMGLTFYVDMNGLNMPKVTDPPPIQPNISRINMEPKWQDTKKDLEIYTLWDVKQIYKDKHTLIVDVNNSFNTYNQVRLDKAVAVLNRDAPDSIDSFEVHHIAAGDVLASENINRSEWIKQKTQPARSQEIQEPTKPVYEIKTSPDRQALLDQKSIHYWVRPELDFIQTLGGPDGYLYQFSGALEMGLELPYNLKVNSKLRYRLHDNYSRFTPAWSNMPQVRTHIAEYLNTPNKDSIDNLTISKTERLSSSWYATAYSGIYEMMYKGAGGEILYRQPASNWAIGFDINHVRQRDFKQYFGNRDYSINTGHLTGYWSTPFEGINAALSWGQYLARDQGVTASISKHFSNGSTIATYVTKTNVPAAVFGEGSFDKGIAWTIPFDAFLTSSSRFSALWSWKPLIRDGGATVRRPVYLFAETAWVSPLAKAYKPSAPSNETVAPDDRIEDYDNGVR